MYKINTITEPNIKLTIRMKFFVFVYFLIPCHFSFLYELTNSLKFANEALVVNC